MIKILNEGTYDFVDSFLFKIQLDEEMFDFNIWVDYFMGNNRATDIVIKLEDVKKLNYSLDYDGTRDDKWGPYTLGYVTVKKIDDLFEIEIESSVAIDSSITVLPIIKCLCKRISVESNIDLEDFWR